MDAQPIDNGQARKPGGRAGADEGALWAALAAATDGGAFCQAWLDLQCAGTPGARAAVILLESENRVFAPAAIWPQGIPRDITTLREAAEKALASGEAVIDTQANGGQAALIAYPISTGDRLAGVIVLDMAMSAAAVLQETLRRMHWGVGWIASMVWRHRADEEGQRNEAAAVALDLMAVVQEHDRLDASAMALCNALATELSAKRVSIGLVRRNAVKLLAVSHAATFQKRSDIAEAIEAAMEEALDQRAMVVVPPMGPSRVTLQQSRLANMDKAASVASFPIEDRGVIVAVLTVERNEETGPLGAGETELCELALALVGPLIAIMRKDERWFAGKARLRSLQLLQGLFGPRRPAAKAIGLVSLLLLIFLLLPFARFRIAADAALEGSVQRAVSVPFSSFIATSNARAGDVVKAGQVLATLDDRDAKLDRMRWAAQVAQLDKQYREALADHKRAEMNLYGAQLGQARAQLDLAEFKLARTTLKAPIAGVLVSGDVSQLVGTPVEEGNALFEVAPLDSFRVALKVQERDISYLRVGQKGSFAPTGLAGQTVDFTVTKLTSVTASDEGKNVFRVEAQLDPSASRTLRPGMEGVAKVQVGHRSRLWIWTRGLRDWLRLFFWKWLP